MDQKILRDITKDILSEFRSSSKFKESIVMKDYHGFQKGRILLSVLKKIANNYSVSTDELQAELVYVTKDLSDEIHLHHHSRAYCIILGSKEHCTPPKNAFAYLNNKWFSVKEGDAIDIPPNTPHGFTVKSGGILYFLSVQTPPIEDGKGKDDYERIEGVSEFV